MLGLQLAQKKADWRLWSYVRVHGNRRTFESRRTIVAFNIRPILDFNEVSAQNCWACMTQATIYFAR